MILAGVPMDAYVRDAFHDGPPSLSASIANALLTRSALHAWIKHPRLCPTWEPEEAGRFDLGSAAHAVLLEGRRDLLAVCPFNDWRTKLAQLAREDARLAGKIPVLTEQADAIEAMVDAAQAKLATSPDLAGLGQLLAEQTIRWQDGPTWLRCRPDWLTVDGAVAISFKTTGNAEPDAFTRHLLSMGYEVQAAFELAGVKAATGVDATYIWLAQEIAPPYACSLLGVSPDLYDFAQSRFRAAVLRWAHCMESGVWPAYPDRVCYPDVPPWARAQWMEREAAHALVPPGPVIDDGRDVSDQLMEMRNG